MAPFHYVLKAPSVSNLDLIEHTTVYLTSLKAIKNPVLCMLPQGRYLQFYDGFSWGSKPEPHR